MATPMTKAEWEAAMKKWKVPVKYYSGWATRDRPGAFSSINGIIIHHTGSDSQSDDYLKFLFVTGRPADGIPGPLCQVSTDMDGDVWVGAAGRANHAGRGSSATLNEVVTESYKGYTSELKPGADNTDGNAHFYGNEVRFDGGQPMTDKQWNSAVLWSAAICDHYGWSALSVIGHREWSSRKPDPGSTKMYAFRAAVAARLKAGPAKPPTKPPVTPPPAPEDDMVTPNDVVGTDADGSPMTMAELAARTNFNYQAIVEGGKVDVALDGINAKLDQLAAAIAALTPKA
jgi:hypothetical protein